MDKIKYINCIKDMPEPRYIYGAGKVGHIILSLCNRNDVKISHVYLTPYRGQYQIRYCEHRNPEHG